MANAAEEEIVSTQNQTIDFLRNISLFAKLTDGELSKFTDVSRIKSFKKGKVLYLEDEDATCFYIICSGWLKLFHTTEDGEEIVLAMLTTDSIAGKTAIFEKAHYTSSLQVVEDAQLLIIPLQMLTDQLKINNQLALNMLGSMVRYQRIHERQLEQYLLYSAPQRIGCFLLGLCPILEQKDGVVLQLPYDKTLIASALGMKGATFSRALNILRQETGINITGTRVKIDSMKRLLKFVDGCYSSYSPLSKE